MWGLWGYWGVVSIVVGLPGIEPCSTGYEPVASTNMLKAQIGAAPDIYRLLCRLGYLCIISPSREPSGGG